MPGATSQDERLTGALVEMLYRTAVEQLALCLKSRRRYPMSNTTAAAMTEVAREICTARISGISA